MDNIFKADYKVRISDCDRFGRLKMPALLQMLQEIATEHARRARACHRSRVRRFEAARFGLGVVENRRRDFAHSALGRTRLSFDVVVIPRAHCNLPRVFGGRCRRQAAVYCALAVAFVRYEFAPNCTLGAHCRLANASRNRQFLELRRAVSENRHSRAIGGIGLFRPQRRHRLKRARQQFRLYDLGCRVGSVRVCADPRAAARGHFLLGRGSSAQSGGGFLPAARRSQYYIGSLGGRFARVCPRVCGLARVARMILVLSADGLRL